MTVTVKQAETEEEIADVFSVRRTVFINEQNVPETIEIDEKENQSLHFIAYKDQRPVGAGRLRLEDKKAKAERVCVLTSLRNTGIGAIIMNEMENKAVECGASVMVLNAQLQALSFYSGLGYEAVSDIFYDAGIEHKTMEKQLIS
ncbi:GNAT family N-acetyltransferase [Salisediminibacterium halotolerans]|uniref:GNAT family N-acetyltransferase n=1 Tax=Salisediminibacterium halotolerans TaxID=517425 RepID=UPI000EB54DE5|nr:GNAT family N-acetyltransferase [Salisediminibacterium halotolerans]RLJ74379.1 putative GNAT family N-acyltransferase [Actinophytocola xinjiangensis]RPE87528.1 putative GNAT family N-acyltransferase [Salisediminibacterium halotolerans]TWG35216.1 putative GNAT family N-acyltransferase [Salisediminibacterium halotolerans]GEL08153.1 putative N-acetyltransferase YjcF [Salisediminibacterium halotolerans]